MQITVLDLSQINKNNKTFPENGKNAFYDSSGLLQENHHGKTE
jgi:hypothetical protein